MNNLNMRIVSRLIVLASFLASLFGISFAGEQMTGRQIMEKQRDLHQSKNEEFKQDMNLIDRNGNTTKREVENYYLKAPDGLSKTMIIFLSPADVRGTGLLTWEQKGREDDQWLYLPASGKERRIAASGKKNKFMGTDFAYEDLRPENLDSHTYNLVGSEVVGGKDCYVVEALPSTDQEKSESGYSKRKFWVRKDIFLTIKKEFYNKQGQLEKASADDELENISGSMWRAKRAAMEDLKAKHKTVLATTERKIDKGIPDSQFSLRELTKK